MLRSKKRKYCEHCQDYVSVRTFKVHKMEFYNTETKQWTIRQDVVKDSAKQEFFEKSDTDDDQLISGTSNK